LVRDVGIRQQWIILRRCDGDRTDWHLNHTPSVGLCRSLDSGWGTRTASHSRYSNPWFHS